jgi:hypothetical protein
MIGTALSFAFKFKLHRYMKAGAELKRRDNFYGTERDGSGDGRGLHSFTSQLNLSAFYGIGGARWGCVARVIGVLGGV